MILSVMKAQILVERFMIVFLEAHGKDPKHFFFTSQKIKECRRIDPPEVREPHWHLLTLCSHVRNELAHSLDDAAIKKTSDAVREAYLAITPTERQKQGIREMDDTQMVTSALFDCGSYVVLATENKIEADKASA